MLNKSDLAAIKNIVDDSLKNHPTHADLDKKLNEQDSRFDKKLNEQDFRFDKKLKSVKKAVRKSENTIIAHFDRETTHLKKRVDHLDDHLGLPHLQQSL